VTWRLVQGYFAGHDLGPQALKGVEKPVQAYQVLGTSGAQSRLDVVPPRGLTPLVGREAEVALLCARWAQARDGLGQVVVLSGEAGIGKSRLVQVLHAHVAAEPHVRVEWRCSPYAQQSPLHPVITHLHRLLRWRPEDPPEEKLRTLEETLEGSGLALPEIVPLLAALLSLPLPERYPPLSLTPQRQRQKTLEAVLAWLLTEATRQPVLFIVEDLHWIDPSTLEFLSLLIDQGPTACLLTLLTCRPEFPVPWGVRSHLTPLTLNRLPQPQIPQMIGRVAGGKALPPEVVAQIVAKTDGVPLFVEELTKTVLESGLLREREAHYDLTGPLPSLAIPATLHDALMARLDRLATVKAVAQLGATIGRTFAYDLLQAVSSLDEATLQQGLRQLVEAELVYQRGSPPQATYTFKHALIQDAAYQSLLRSTRQQYHQRIAQVVEAHFAETAETQPELLAHHCAQAGWIEKAIAYWGRAGRQALARSAMIESVAHVRKGLDLLAHLPEGPERWRQELDLQRVLGAALLASKGNAAPETGEAYARARELCERLGDTASLIPVLGGLSTYHQTRGEYAAMRRISEDLLRIGERQDDTAGSLVGSRSMGLCLYHLGEFVAARPYLERVLDLYTPEAHNALVTITSFDVRTGALSYLSMIRCIQGQPEQAASFSGQALTVSRNLRNPHNLAFALNYAAVSKLLRRVELEAEELLDELLSLAIEHGFPVWLGTANIMRGYVLAGRDETGAGLALARKGWADWAATGARYHGTYYLGLLAQTCVRAGQTDEALELVAMALETVDRMGERWFEAELRRVQGEWLVVHRRQEIQRAEACFHRAMAVAREQNARTWELRAAMSLARLWQQQGKRDEARQLLAPVDGWFTEGFDMADLQGAKVLLEELQ
jgi:predicted ATPase